MSEPAPPTQAASSADIERRHALQRTIVNAGGLMALLGFQIVSVEPGRMVFSATPAEAHMNPFETVHGGYIAALLDSAMGFAAQTMLGEGLVCTTLELKISYVRALTVGTGPVLAEGLVLRAGRRVVFAEGKVTDSSGQLLASGSSTLLVLEPETARSV